MDESQIAAQLASTIPTEPVEAPRIEEAPNTDISHSNGELNTNDHMILADFFGLNRTEMWSDDKQRQVREVYRFASEIAGTNELSKVIDIVRQMELQLGITMKSNKLFRLARFVELKRQSNLINAQMQGVIHGE